jgi:hypothetical protein
LTLGVFDDGKLSHFESFSYCEKLSLSDFPAAETPTLGESGYSHPIGILKTIIVKHFVQNVSVILFVDTLEHTEKDALSVIAFIIHSDSTLVGFFAPNLILNGNVIFLEHFVTFQPKAL